MNERCADSTDGGAASRTATGRAETNRLVADGAPAVDGSTLRSVRLPDGRRVAYAEYGNPEGVPVCFLHGTPGSRLLGGLFADRAFEAGVRVFAPDRPGYGRSDAEPVRTPADAGRVVAAVADEADASRVGLVGFSGGGPHALAAAATRGDRVRRVDVVAGAVPPSLRSSPPPTLRLLEILCERMPSLAARLVGAQARLARRAPPSLVTSQYTSVDGALPDGVADLVARDFAAAFARHRRGFVTETRLLAHPWEFSLEDVAAPVGLWHGDEDANVPVEGARRLAAWLPEADLTVLDGADHLRSLLRSRVPVLERHATDG
ncbi:alpha/beta hydrolase [Halogeometricum sp. S1BR25-6]|uniref:Alpha/beta hydrolase n=1 Tax=Halogeometricum salsisoli TaxID=2950536 RepID=A0ABU2GEW1_9EURY|nr:alpha/beta hydrolase [Halogeometricum sp. S1BR25-6]MDS0299309.1 alpha/beta hydrolase [Halogeometricum sp. S1BR25-6]